MKREIDFQKAYTLHYAAKQSKNAAAAGARRARNACIAFLVIGALAIGGATGWLQYQRTQLLRQADTIQASLNSSPQLQAYASLQEVESQYETLKASNDQTESLQDLLKGYPALQTGDYEALLAAMSDGMTLCRLSYADTGVLSAVFSCSGASAVPDYVERLRTAGRFRSVTYYGWSAEDGYRFQVDCLLQEGDAQ